jgi:hypothetical protein
VLVFDVNSPRFPFSVDVADGVEDIYVQVPTKFFDMHDANLIAILPSRVTTEDRRREVGGDRPELLAL